MGTTTFASLNIGKIEWSSGHPWGKDSMIVNGAAEVYPGFALTTVGSTAGTRDVAKPDAQGDSFFGIAGANLDQALDSVYSDNDEIVVYRAGGGWGVYAINKGGSHVDNGDIMVTCGADDTGFLTPMRHVLNATTGASIIGTLLYAIACRAAEGLATSASNQPCKVVLSI